MRDLIFKKGLGNRGLKVLNLIGLQKARPDRVKQEESDNRQ